MITHAFFTRRKLLRSAASASLASGASLAESGRMPPCTLSANIEIMFPKTMPRDERMEVVAALGMKAFSFWGVGSEEEKATLAVQLSLENWESGRPGVRQERLLWIAKS